jgi:catechol 2,3-dioxygenase-like lactoylglutathione lyase family enzyme
MKIRLTSVLVDDQEKALQFYTGALGFVKKRDIPMGEARWLTVVSPEGPDDIELLLEPNSHPAAKVFQQAIFKDGIPLTAFAVDDIDKEYERMHARGVVFKQKPMPAGPVTLAVFDDTCGNLIQIYQPAAVASATSL